MKICSKGSVSSKSLTSKTWSRSGIAKTPKLLRCASPHSYTRMPETGVVARSLAITFADPRGKVKGDRAMRP
jgi:hypothetical protein